MNEADKEMFREALSTVFSRAICIEGIESIRWTMEAIGPAKDDFAKLVYEVMEDFEMDNTMLSTRGKYNSRVEGLSFNV